jgi:SAM-dependent methyltransferase
MTAYEEFAPFYDAVNGEPAARSRQILDYIARFRPESASVLELGCGTGAVLAGLGSGLALTGLDLSPEMLAYAKRRCPSARLYEGDMTTFSRTEQFDVVLCVFDTLNHVATFEGWQSMFERVHAHLVEGGLFIFDINTLGRLRQLGDSAPWVHHFDQHTLIMNVEFDGRALAQWDIRIFEQLHEKHFVLHHEVITELGVQLDQVKNALTTNFELLEETDPTGEKPSDESARANFVFRRRA